MKIDQVAVQMYTLREHAAADLDATFWRLAEIGYKQVEFAGYYGNPVEDVAAMLERHGLRAPASHVPFADFENRFNGVLEDAATLGFEWLIVPSGPIRDVERDAALEAIEKLDAIATKVVDAGFKFGYHNHAFEFETVFDDGSTWYDRLLAGTNPGNVKLELDAFWAKRGGQDPAEMLHTNGDRIRLVHIKDAANDDPSRDVPFGEGSLDWTSILDAARAAGVEYYVTEQDNPGDAFEDVEIALRNAEKWSS